MLISNAFRCALLTVTIAACCTHTKLSNQQQNHGLTADKDKRQITKRDSGVVFKHYPVQAYLKHGPKFIYKRISNPRYRSPRPAYGITRTKRRQENPSRKVMRKYRKSVNPKYDPPRHHKRPPKISYANPKNQNHKPQYNVLKRSPSFFERPAAIPAGFGEPPEDYLFDEKFPKTVTYGKVLNHRDQIRNTKLASNNAHLTIHEMSEPIDLDNEDYQDQAIKTWKTVYLNDFDNNFPDSKTRPPLTIQKSEYEKQTTDDDRNSFAEIYKYEKRMNMDAFNYKKRNSKRADRPKEKNNKPYPQNVYSNNGPKNQIVVGGRYAEPPGRYVSHYHSVSMISDDDDMALPEAVDPDVASSATISPYVNYKNSNMAFSPQNLNDAFSIVD